ncbi:MAG TPA: hypothetical protein VEC16_04920 [Alphaproteobacteria bacterium]|nr:hypothetical protein [Alphaproteobacteria bacterium]
MDSIEKMRRINDLTRELKQRGFAESSFEAIQQANQIYGHEDVEEHVKHGIIVNSQNDKVGRDNMNEAMAETTAYSDRKLSKLSENMDVLTSKMNEIIKAINDMDARITDIKNKHDALSNKHESLASRQASQSNSSQNSQPVSSPSSEGRETRHEAPEAKPKATNPDDNQRTGAFQSQDVSIDKMFYFGKK